MVQNESRFESPNVPSAGGPGRRGLDEHLLEETLRLERSWMRHSEAMLRDYMVDGIHDPRINPQSIQGRHFLIGELFGDRFAQLQEAEWEFATVMLWLAEFLQRSVMDDEIAALEHALAHGADNAEGQLLPHHLRRSFQRLPRSLDELAVPNYVQDVLRAAREPAGARDAVARGMQTFELLWQERLAKEPSPGLSVLEPACGSANDYRAIVGSGLARHVDYVGVDLCAKNIANAREQFPNARFDCGNVFALEHADKSFDCVLVHDLLEHLSEPGLETAVAELCRVTRRGLFVGFFQMHEGQEHILRPVDEYHWNTLSLPRVRALFEEHGGAVQAAHVNTFLRWQVGCGEPVYYDTAYSLYVRF